MKKVIQQQNLSTQIVEYVKDLLLAGELSPGDKITELSIANALSISQPPVREAMQILMAEGFVETKGKRGRYITKMSPQQIMNSYFTGGIIEGGVVAHSLPKFTEEVMRTLDGMILKMKKHADGLLDIDDFAQLDMEFHNYLFSISGNMTARDITFRCCQTIGKYYFYPKWKEMYTAIEKFERHNIIVKAIRSQDKQLVQKTLLEHYTSASEIISRHVEQDEIDFDEKKLVNSLG